MAHKPVIQVMLVVVVRAVCWTPQMPLQWQLLQVKPIQLLSGVVVRQLLQVVEMEIRVLTLSLLRSLHQEVGLVLEDQRGLLVVPEVRVEVAPISQPLLVVQVIPHLEVHLKEIMGQMALALMLQQVVVVLVRLEEQVVVEQGAQEAQARLVQLLVRL